VTEVVVSETPVARAAARLAAAVREAIERGARARLAVPGGSAAHALGEARRALLSDGAWSDVALTWVDERCVPFDDPSSNRGEAYRGGMLDRSTPAACELALYEDGETPLAACERVTAALDRDFAGRLDVALLGMGEDGHVASLFPGRPIPEEALVARVNDSPKPPPDRITLTRRTLATASTTILLATGESKRSALSRLLSGDEMLPAHGLPGLVIVTDLDGLGGGR
jgi:6-phosphogluconolactonase